jgi:hypothetical protein
MHRVAIVQLLQRVVIAMTAATAVLLHVLALIHVVLVMQTLVAVLLAVHVVLPKSIY